MDDTEKEKSDRERSLRSGFIRRMFELAVAGGADAEGLAARVAEVEKGLVVTWSGYAPILSWGNARSRDSREGLDGLARGAFRTSPVFEKESAALEDRRSRQSGFNSQVVTGLFPEPVAETLKDAAARIERDRISRVAGSF